MSQPWSFSASFTFLLTIIFSLYYLSAWRHHGLPEPVSERVNKDTGAPQISEREILEHARFLSEDVGFRTVGTREHAVGDAWMLDKAFDIKHLCEEATKNSPGRKLECEVHRQAGSGSHRFDILRKRLYKTYVNLSNIVIRISDGTEEGKEHAVLVNSHLDSTLPSPGAADDALSVGVMIEAARTLIDTPHWSPKHAIILLFNNAEESLQDGSHLFGTQHPWRESVRAVLNLEAAGTKGRTLVFQATSEQMIDAYTRVPWPFGTIVANDVFSSGIIGSDTDFRQFQLYMNVTGLDMAVVGHSYFYHTRKDLIEYIDPGVAQHMADNTLALLQHLSSPESSLAELTSGYTKPQTVFFSILNAAFFRYGFQIANAMHVVLSAASLALIAMTKPAATISIKEEKKKASVRYNGGTKAQKVAEVVSAPNKWASLSVAAWVLTMSFLGALIGALIVCLIMRVLGRTLSWYSNESSCAMLYGPPSLCGALLFYRAFHPRRPVSERELIQATLLIHAFLAVVLQLAGIGSALLFFASGVSMFLGLVYDAMKGSEGAVALGTYAIGQIIPAVFGAEVFITIASIFVPLTGRMGAEAPAEEIIACLVPITLAYFVPLIIPFFVRFGRRITILVIIATLVTSALSIIVFSKKNPFDDMHPKRLYVIHSENITTNEVSIGVGTSDMAPGFSHLVQDIAGFVTQNKTRAQKVDMHAYNGDWDVLYPFSAYLSPYEVALESYASAYADDRFRVEAMNETTDIQAGTRSLTLLITHPGLIWTTIAFDAHVLKWSLDDSPPDSYTRHFVKEASFYGEDKWSVDLVVKLKSDTLEDERLHINFVGVKENVMWPGKRADKREGRDVEVMSMFERLDGWLEKKTKGAVDLTLLGCVGGVAVV